MTIASDISVYARSSDVVTIAPVSLRCAPHGAVRPQGVGEAESSCL